MQITPDTKRTRKPPAYDPTADIVRPYHLRHATGLSETTVWRYRRQGRFPAPLKLSDGAIGWTRADIGAWLTSRGRK